MSEGKNLPHLLKLLDDDSQFVRAEVIRQIKKLGSSLAKELKDLPCKPTKKQVKLLEKVLSSSEGVKFEPGDIVRHKAYGYYGIIVDRDSRCRDGNHWYLSKKSRNTFKTPWYFVLVHEKNISTYVAQEDLVVDTKHSSISHPLIPYFFKQEGPGQYRRNSRPWPREPKY